MHVPMEHQNNKKDNRFEVLHLSLESVGMHLDIFLLSAGSLKCFLNFLNQYKIMIMIIKNYYLSCMPWMIGFTIVLYSNTSGMKNSGF